MNMNDKKVLTELAKEYFELSQSDENKERMEAHIGVNDLHPTRPIVLIGEFPWNELNFDGLLDTKCVEPENIQMELSIRQKLMQWKYFPGDMVLEPYFTVQKMMTGNDIGVAVKQECIKTDETNNISAHHYINQFRTEEDIEKLHNTNIVYLEKESVAKHEYFSDVFDGVIPVHLNGIPTNYLTSHHVWDVISHYMGVNDLLFDMIDRPEFMHKLVRKLTDIHNDQLDQMEKLNLFNAEAMYCHTASALSNDIKKNPIIDGKVTRKNIWGRGIAQILTSVSPAMHDEFDIQYMMESMKPFGLVYYGCCESLDNKIDLVKKIPNLRKICLSPWASMESGAEHIGRDYVMSAKPNPATIGNDNLDIDQAKKELSVMINSAQKNNCPLEIVMKDISTISYNPQNLIQWSQLALSMIK